MSQDQTEPQTSALLRRLPLIAILLVAAVGAFTLRDYLSFDTLRDNRAVHAMARILLHGRIDNIQTSWVKLGVEGTRTMLTSGANDVGGTLMEETISRMAGSEHGSAKTVEELVEIGAGIDRPVRERTTLYGVPVPR